LVVITNERKLKTNNLRAATQFIILAWVLFPGCQVLDGSMTYPIPAGAVTVQGDRIYHDGDLFAELRYFNLPYDKTKLYCTGFSIYYYPYDKEVWIYPKQGWRVVKDNKQYSGARDVDRIWNEYEKQVREYSGASGQAPKTVRLLLGNSSPPKFAPTCMDVRISADGRYVYYKAGSGLYGVPYKYLVEYGISKRRFNPF
jgi:hypothetical protein